MESAKVEIISTGGLFGEAKPEDFSNINYYRNPELALAIKNLGYVNKFNVGVKRAIKLLKENGNLAPMLSTTIDNDKYSIAMIKQYHSLMAMETKNPIFNIKPTDEANNQYMFIIDTTYFDISCRIISSTVIFSASALKFFTIL